MEFNTIRTDSLIFCFGERWRAGEVCDEEEEEVELEVVSVVE